MYSHVRFKYICYVLVINTTIKTTSVCDGDAQSVVAGWPVILMGWPVTGDDGRGQPASSRRCVVQVYTAHRHWLGVVTCRVLEKDKLGK